MIIYVHNDVATIMCTFIKNIFLFLGATDLDSLRNMIYCK